MELAVWDYDRLGPSELLGSVVIGWNEKSNETTLSRVSAATHWQQMLENPRRPIVYWHQLKVKLQPAFPVKTLCPFFVQCILLYSGFYSISCGFISASSWHTVNSKHAALTLLYLGNRIFEVWFQTFLIVLTSSESVLSLWWPTMTGDLYKSQF